MEDTKESTKDLLINSKDEMLNFCKRAFIKCIDEIKLRNIGGMILIDFPRLSPNRKKILHEFFKEIGRNNFSEINFLGIFRICIGI